MAHFLQSLSKEQLEEHLATALDVCVDEEASDFGRIAAAGTVVEAILMCKGDFGRLGEPFISAITLLNKKAFDLALDKSTNPTQRLVYIEFNWDFAILAGGPAHVEPEAYAWAEDVVKLRFGKSEGSA